MKNWMYEKIHSCRAKNAVHVSEAHVEDTKLNTQQNPASQ